MENRYPKTRELIESFIGSNVYHFDRAQKALILDTMIQEGNHETTEKIWMNFSRAEIIYLLSFLKDFTTINALLIKVHLIDQMYKNILEEVEEIIDGIIMEREGWEMSDTEEHRFFDNLERARDMKQEIIR